MTKGLPRSLSRGTPLRQHIVKNTILARALTLSVTDVAVQAGWGTVVLSGLPEGNILLLGAVSYMQFTTVDADIGATFDGDMAIGTAPSVDNIALATDKANIIPTTALGAATAKVSPVVRGTTTGALTGIVLDNTAATLELNLNILIDDGDIAGDADFTVDGELYLSYVMLGDD